MKKPLPLLAMLLMILAMASGCDTTIPVTGISLDKTSAQLKEGETLLLKATVVPSDATDATVSWSSSNTSVASVSATGTVTAITPGQATITATASDKKATCAVTVVKKEIPVTGVSLNKTSLSLSKGASETLVATVSPSDATDKSLFWSSSNTSVAVVDQNGKVTAIVGGTSTITVKAGTFTATCEVTVPVELEAISISAQTTDMDTRQTQQLTLIGNPTDAPIPNVVWSSSDEAVAKVDQNGVVTAGKGGTATITATVGSLTATVTIKVTQLVEEIVLQYTSLELLQGLSKSIGYTLLPEGCTQRGEVTFTSTDTSVATVSGWTVTAQGLGTCEIVVSLDGVSAKCTFKCSELGGAHEGTGDDIWKN